MKEPITCPSCDQKTYDVKIGHCSDNTCSYHLTETELIARLNRLECNKLSKSQRSELLQEALTIINKKA